MNAFTGVNDLILSENVLAGFIAGITPLRALSTSLNSEAAKAGDKIDVLLIGAQDGALTKASHGAYTMQDTENDKRQVVLGQPKYVSATIDDVEKASSSVLSLELFGQQKGYQLAKQVFIDILALVTAAKFGPAVFNGPASGFDSDDLVNIRTACTTADMPRSNRALIIDETYIGSLLKDGAFKDASAFGSATPIKEGAIGRASGFDVFESTIIPANGEDLVGIAAHPAGLAVAMRYLKPQDGHKYNIATPLTDAETGITIGLRDWYDENTGERKRVWECVMGAVEGVSAGIKRITNAA